MAFIVLLAVIYLVFRGFGLLFVRISLISIRGGVEVSFVSFRFFMVFRVEFVWYIVRI